MDYGAVFRALGVPQQQLVGDGNGCFLGQRWSKGHMAFVRRGIKLKSSEDRARSAEPLAKAWNHSRTRYGDTVDLAEDVDGPTHPNAFRPSAILEFAYSSVGRHLRRHGLDGSTHHLDTLVGVAGIMRSAAARHSQADLAVLRRLRLPFVFARHYDFSPWKVAFGSLQAEIMPHARYYQHNGERWVAVAYQEMHQRFRGNLRYGVSELLAKKLLRSIT